MDDGILGVIFFLLVISCIIWFIVKFISINKLNKILNKQVIDLKLENERLFKQKEELTESNKTLTTENLKFQLQPHTLGNVIDTLKSIAKNLHRGTESLAESLKYILYNGNNHFVTVEEEVNFISEYIKLNELLYSNIISINIDDTQLNRFSKYYNTPCIPHLITAYLIENAFKHGDIRQADFLKIRLKLTESSFEITVVNRISNRIKESKQGGLGLKNMQKRLEILLKGKYIINSTCNLHEYSANLIINF